ncbi:GNAT family N-acetyltransferase [Paeniglutamicibacter antarcticus]|uniref:GNAT family N-acetyltransferase n=1 Tax=Arthrobacter terrae TaxID=2935737 RepID=A0A931G3R9_9MICC|nr:GNAT family N-acetyltransferase [Arthrobacter terrae]
MLIPVSDQTLEQLVVAATTDATADEVTPPLTPGGEWTSERIEWLRHYHRSNSAGPNGATGESTWAVVASGVVCGSARLKANDEKGVFETGIWLTQTARGRGVARAAMAGIIEKAAERGAREVIADTAAGNLAAQRLLDHLGFQLSPSTETGRVEAKLELTSPTIV